MLGREDRLFSLDYSLHISFFQMLVNSVGIKRLVDDIGEGLGHLNSIFCLVSRDKMDGMADISMRKFGWTTSSGLLQVGMLFGIKPRDSGDIEASGRGNRASRMARIKHSQDGVLLSGGDGSHDGRSWEERSV
jgi:hypothetical protein